MWESESEQYVSKYERWQKKHDEEERDRIAQLNAGVVVYRAVSGFTVYSVNKKEEKHTLTPMGTFNDLVPAQDFMFKKQREIRNPNARWIIYWKDQFGESHYQRWDGNSWAKGDLSCAVAYPESLVKYVKEKAWREPGWRYSFELESVLDND